MLCYNPNMSIYLLSMQETQDFLTKKDLITLEKLIEDGFLRSTVDHDVADPYVIVRGKAISLFVIMTLIGKE